MQPAITAATLSPWEPDLLAMLTYGAMVLALMALLLFFCAFLGEKKSDPEKARAYESGVIPTGLALLRSPAAFYLVAVFFLIFDVEAAFIFSWAVSFYGLGWAGWIQMTFFIVLLLFGLLYVWKKGGLEWGTTASPPSCNSKTSC
ncbi:MAG: NADH-quinone oxidoreductase subunit A [Deltaproteobacteria bacterium]|nr:NADH-quinone oxidoreductase subunit A [Deltaproteobacteria bacterium]